MPETKPLHVTLETLAMGAAGELFDREMGRALQNIQDPNTDPRAKRSVVLTITIEPDDAREEAAYLVNVTSKLAGVRPHASRMYLGEQNGQLVAVMFNPRQADLFSGEQDSSVSPIVRNQGVTS